jgi:hypothetical protein
MFLGQVLDLKTRREVKVGEPSHRKEQWDDGEALSIAMALAGGHRRRHLSFIFIFPRWISIATLSSSKPI